MKRILFILLFFALMGSACKRLGQKGLVDSKDADIEMDDDPGVLIQPSNAFVLSKLPVTAIEPASKTIEIAALGNITYDTRMLHSISSRVAGRIEKLWIRYRFQKITKGQKIMEIYSPEIITAEEHLLFLLQNDPDNAPLIAAAKERLLLLGMNQKELSSIMETKVPLRSLSVYSEFNGHIHDAISKGSMNPVANGMKDIALLTEELTLKEGMYLQKGQSVFTVYDPSKAWAILSIFGEYQSLVRKGSALQFFAETAPDRLIKAQIDFIEPFYRKEDKTLTVRAFFDNSKSMIPMGSQVKATIITQVKDANWLPETAVLSMGLGRVAFIREADGFKATPIKTGLVQGGRIQVLGGLDKNDSVAINAQYLMDSESFIKIKK